MQKRSFRAMGCRMLVALDRGDAKAARALEPVPGWFEEWEQQLSRFHEASDLSRLNRSQGEPQQVGEVLWQVLQVALDAAKASEGLVTPVVLDALEAAGYRCSFEEWQAAPDQPATLEPSPPGSASVGDLQQAWRAIQTDPSRQTVHLPPGVRLDLGGIAKGWAAEQTMLRLRREGPVLVDCGGDIAISGPRANGSRWPVGIADPRTPNVQLELLMVKKGGVATSGRDYRRWQSGGVWQHHLIDPRTGKPAETDVLSVTIVAPTIGEAEIVAKRVMLEGSETGFAWLEAQPTLAGLLVCEGGRVMRSRRLRQHVW